MRFFIIFFIVGIFFFGCTNENNDGIFSLEEKGDIAFSRREYLKAANIWNKGYLRNQKNIALIRKIGDCYLKLGRLERAKLFYQKAVELNPDLIDIQIKLAQVHILTWDLPEADKICEILGKNHIEHPDLDLIRADLSLMSNRPAKAENYYRKAAISSKDSLRTLMKLAIFLKSVKKHEEAFEILKIVKNNDIVSFRISLLLSDYYLLDDNPELAELSILDAIRLEPEDSSLKYHLVQFYIATENILKAEMVLENILKNQEDIYLRMMLSDIYILNNKLEKAEKIILDLKEKIKEPTIEFELLQGKYWLYSGRSVFATSHLKSALELNPGLANARYLLGLTHMINGKQKLCEHSLTRTLQIYPDHYRALLLISELLYKRKEYDLSIKYLDRFLSNYPEDFTGHLIKGLNLLGQKKYLPAKTEFNKSRNLNTRTHLSYYYLGMTEELMGNNIQALKIYKQVLEKYPDFIDLSYRYCMLLIETNQNKVADDFINKRLMAKENSPDVYFLAAKKALKTGDLSKGEAFLKKAIQCDFVPGFIYMELADFYKNNHKIKDAIKILKQCNQKKPYYQDAWLALSKLYVETQDLTTALDILQKGYKKFQGSPIFQSNIAWLLLEDNQQINKALSYAQSAYEKMPDNTALADTLGWAYYHKGIYSQAIWLLSEALEKLPENGFIRYHIGMTYYQQGAMEKAIKHLKIAQKSEESKYYFHEIEMVLSELLKAKQDESNNKLSEDTDLILSPPGNGDINDDVITPQWKQ